MSVLLQEMTEKALKLNIPLSVQLDLTYRCNERCVHCYLDHDDHGEMTTAEIKHLLDEMADAGVFILTLSGGEIFLRKDFFDLLEHARRLMFCVKLKTNAVLIREREAARLRDLGVESVQISIYSHRPEVHDAITLIPGSLKRSVDAIRFLKSQGLKVIIANVLMTQNMQDYPGVRALAAELGVECTLDPTITPMMDGNRSVLDLGVDQGTLRQVFRDARAGRRCGRVLRDPSRTRRERTGIYSLQRWSHRLLRFAVWRSFSLRPVSASHGKRTTAALRRHLAPFRPDERSALHPPERPYDLHFVHPRWQLHALSRSGLHGRQHARPVDAGLREIIRQNRRPLSQHAGQEGRRKSGARESGTEQT
jgi:organic radical activating enzyme